MSFNNYIKLPNSPTPNSQFPIPNSHFSDSTVATSPDEHLVTSLPGLKGGDFKEKQHAGHIPVVDGYFFYWLVESSSADPASDPLVIWLNGGPVRELLSFRLHVDMCVQADGHQCPWDEFKS